MALVRAVDGTYISYPFISDGDTTTKIYNLVCTQRASDYNAAQIALDDNMSSAANAGVIDLPSGWADSNAYFVGDTGHAPIAGGMISFTRTFANIPQSITISSGSAFVTFPGIVGYGAIGSSLNVSTAGMTAGTRGLLLTTTSEHGLTTNDTVYLSMDYTVGSDPFIHQVMGQFLAYSVPSTTSLIVDIGQNWNDTVFINASNIKLRKNDLVRDPISYNVSTQTRYDYILPGVTSWANDVLDIQVTSPFYAVTADGEPTDSVNDTIPSPLTLPTVPDATTYVNMIKNEHHLVIESSLSEWAGNILVQKTKTCKAR